MSITPVDATTGSTVLPDIGTLSYNGVTFSCLYKSTIRGVMMPDNAKWTIKYTEYTIRVEGVVVPDLSRGAVAGTAIDFNMLALRHKLEAPGGALVYGNKGFGFFRINIPDSNRTLKDVDWGPWPRILDFQPLGGQLAAMVIWECVVRIYEFQQDSILTASLPGLNLVQFNQEIGIHYDEQGYSTLEIKGTLEIPLTRKKAFLSGTNRQVPATVDNFREQVITALMASFDLKRFRITRRDFPVSRDRRTMEFDIVAEELPPQALPPWATTAHGTYSVKPRNKFGAQWLCSLRLTYSIGKWYTRRTAFFAFMSVVKYRMEHSVYANTDNPVPPTSPRVLPEHKTSFPGPTVAPPGASNQIAPFYEAVQSSTTLSLSPRPANIKIGKELIATRSILVDYRIDEGMYLDSKTVTFEASWTLITSLSHLMYASGIWQSPPGMKGAKGQNNWATSVAPIMGWRSFSENAVEPNQSVIVDLGGN